VIARTNYAEMYYSAPQQLAHHPTAGCAMHGGALLGSGTISGPRKGSRGSPLPTYAGRGPFQGMLAAAKRLGTFSLDNFVGLAHLLAFFAGTRMLVLVSLAWTWVLGISYVGTNVITTLPPPIAQWAARIEALPYFEKTFPPHWRG